MKLNEPVEVSVPFDRVVVSFEMSPSPHFETERDHIQVRYDSLLAAHHKSKAEPRFSGAPKLDIEKRQSKDGTPIVDYNFRNETGFRCQVINGEVLGECISPEAFHIFLVAYDLLLQAYRESVVAHDPREFEVQFKSVLKLTVRNDHIMAKLVPSLKNMDGVLKPLAKFGNELLVQRSDFSTALYLGEVELVFDFKAPANEDNKYLQTVWVCRSPQEEYASDNLFSLSKLTRYLNAGFGVLASLVEGTETSLAHP